MTASGYTKPPPIDKVLARFPDARKTATGWQTRCPAHDDRTASLSVSVGKDSTTVLMKCHAGCDNRDIAKAAGFELRDLFAERDSTNGGPRRRIVATYDYTDARGAPIFQVVRHEPKAFAQRRPDGNGGWVWNLKGITPVLYHLPEVMASDDVVIVCEGEKDVDRLRELGLVATTAPMGAGKWRQGYTDTLAGREVVLVPDNDEPGRQHMDDVAAQLHAAGCLVTVVDLPGLDDHGDVSDWLDMGFTGEELLEFAREVPEWTKACKGEPVTSDDHLSDLSGKMSTLGTLLADVEPEPIRWLSRGRFAAGKLTMVDGDPGLGKSTVMTDWAARITRGLSLPDGESGKPRGVVILSAEDGTADTIRPRAEAAGADLTRIRVLTELPDGSIPTIPANLALIEASIRSVNAALLIVDPLVAFIGEGFNTNRDQDVRRALAPFKAMAERNGVAVAAIRHLNKMPGANALYRGGGSIGLVGAARFGLLFARDPEDDDRCIIAGTKANLSRLAPSLAYTLESSHIPDIARVVWLGESAMTAGGLLAGQEDEGERGAGDEARAFLRDYLETGPQPVKALKAAARDAGVSDATLQRAKRALGVRAVKAGFGGDGHWTWALPTKVSNAPKDVTDDHLSTSNPPKVIINTPKNTKALIECDGEGVHTLGLNGRVDEVVTVDGVAGHDRYTA